MSLAWELSTKVAHSGSQLTLIPSSLSNRDQQLHACRHLDPNTLVVARWMYRMDDSQCPVLSADPGQLHARPGTQMSLSARSSGSQ